MTLRGSGLNLFGAIGGPLPQVTVPLEAQLGERGIKIEILRLAFDLKIRNVLVGQGEIGPYDYLRTKPIYLAATAICPQPALAYQVNPDPPQGRITLTLVVQGPAAVRAQFPTGRRARPGP